MILDESYLHKRVFTLVIHFQIEIVNLNSLSHTLFNNKIREINNAIKLPNRAKKKNTISWYLRPFTCIMAIKYTEKFILLHPHSLDN